MARTSSWLVIAAALLTACGDYDVDFGEARVFIQLPFEMPVALCAVTVASSSATAVERTLGEVSRADIPIGVADFTGAPNLRSTLNPGTYRFAARCEDVDGLAVAGGSRTDDIRVAASSTIIITLIAGEVP